MEEKPILKIERLNKYFESLHVLKDIDLEVRNKETVSIIGSSGSGKSTLLRCIAKLERVDSGKIIFRMKKFKGLRKTNIAIKKWEWFSSS